MECKIGKKRKKEKKFCTWAHRLDAEMWVESKYNAMPA